MNLVKLQDDLKMLPMAALQAKAQGQDPSVPPWLATSVLNERMDAQKKASLAQGAKGDQPSIAEQLNQKAGLMALQGQQQQQAQQQMMQQMAQAPQPAPANVPQPEQQPQPQMMAQGGLARLPVNPRMFDYRAGGIIRFANEGDVPEADPGANLDAVKAQAEQAIANLQTYGTIKRQQNPEGYKQALAAVESAKQAIQQAQTAYQASMSASGMDKPYIAPQKPFRNLAPVSTPVEQQVQAAYQKPKETSADVAQQGLRSLQTPPKPVAPQPAQPVAAPRPNVAPRPVAPASQAPASAPPTGMQSDLPKSDIQNMQLAALKREVPEPQVSDAQADYRAASPAILKEPAGLAQLARLKQQQEQYEAGKANRPMENWMRGLAAAAQGGIGGFGTSYLETAEGNRAADAAQAKYQNDVNAAIEAMQRGEATTEQKNVLESLKDSRTRKAEADRTRGTNLTTAAGNELQSQTQLTVADLTRKTQILLHNTPAAQRPTVEENAIRDFMKTGLSYAQAYERVKQIGGEVKRGLTYDQASDNAQKILDNPMYMMEIKRKAKEAGKPAPSMEEVHKKLIIDMLNDANNYKPSSGTSPATSTPQPTMAADRAAQFKVIR